MTRCCRTARPRRPGQAPGGQRPGGAQRAGAGLHGQAGPLVRPRSTTRRVSSTAKRPRSVVSGPAPAEISKTHRPGRLGRCRDPAGPAGRDGRGGGCGCSVVIASSSGSCLSGRGSPGACFGASVRAPPAGGRGGQNGAVDRPTSTRSGPPPRAGAPASAGAGEHALGRGRSCSRPAWCGVSTYWSRFSRSLTCWPGDSPRCVASMCCSSGTSRPVTAGRALFHSGIEHVLHQRGVGQDVLVDVGQVLDLLAGRLAQVRGVDVLEQRKQDLAQARAAAVRAAERADHAAEAAGGGRAGHRHAAARRSGSGCRPPPWPPPGVPDGVACSAGCSGLGLGVPPCSPARSSAAAAAGHGDRGDHLRVVDAVVGVRARGLEDRRDTKRRRRPARSRTRPGRSCWSRCAARGPR